MHLLTDLCIEFHSTHGWAISKDLLLASNDNCNDESIVIWQVIRSSSMFMIRENLNMSKFIKQNESMKSILDSSQR